MIAEDPWCAAWRYKNHKCLQEFSTVICNIWIFRWQVLRVRVRDGTNMYSYYKKTDHRILLPNSWGNYAQPKHAQINNICLWLHTHRENECMSQYMYTESKSLNTIHQFEPAFTGLIFTYYNWIACIVYRKLGSFFLSSILTVGGLLTQPCFTRPISCRPLHNTNPSLLIPLLGPKGLSHSFLSSPQYL